MTKPLDASSKKIHRSHEKLAVRVGLAEEDREPAVMKLLAVLRKQGQIKTDAAEARAAFNQELKDVKEKVQEATMTLEYGREEMVDCEVTKNFGTGKVTVKRLDTGKAVPALAREITDEDKQLALGETASDAEGTTGEGHDGAESRN